MLSTYDPAKCGTLFMPDLAEAAREGRKFARENNIKAARAGGDEPFIILTIIDNQIDFVSPPSPDGSYPGGALYVPGAEKDTDRLNRFIYNNVAAISHILISLDTHYLYQPFHPFDWIAGSNPATKKDGTVYQTGDHPQPFTIITLAHVQGDVWLPTRMPNRRMQMLEKLDKEGKKQLCIWPVHCCWGNVGYSLDPTLMEAIVFHSSARQNRYAILDKGKSDSSEHYGIWGAEARFDDDPSTHLRMDMINRTSDADANFIAGQARTHCVMETLEQSVGELSKKAGDLVRRIHVLNDCMSNVPDIVDEHGTTIVPFAKMTDDRMNHLRDQMQVKFVKSTDPINI